MTTGWDGPVARFHRAAAAVLRDASSPDEAAGALVMVRGVVLGQDPSPRMDENDDVREASSSSSRALASEYAEARGVSSKDDASRWVGFDAVGEEMLHCVAPRWLPLMRSHERRALHDEILAAMPPTIAIRVLVPALSPSSTATGRDLDERSKTAVATEAARALAAALERGIARDIVSNLSPTDGADDAVDAINALMSAADRLELPPGSHSCVAALHPTALARTVATQLCDATRRVNGNDGTRTAVFHAAASCVSRACRRGDADGVADAFLDCLVTDSCADVSRPDWANELVDAMPDAHAAAKLAQAALGRGAARGLSWRACERLLRSMFSARFRRCVSTRHAICDGMLLRRPQPRRVLPALIRIALVDPPVGFSSEDAAVTRHRRTVAAACVDAWSQIELVRGGSGAMQGHVASVLAASIATGCLIQSGGDTKEGDGGGAPAVTPAGLMRGISARLDSPDARIRRHGQKVAVALSRVMSPDRPLTFDDAEDYGASETAGTVSEDEEAWERDAWRLKEGSAEEEEDAEADSFVASVLSPETPEDTPETPDDDDDREAEHDETDEDLQEDFDDPDGAVRLGGGARREDSSDDESDEDDASSEGSALEPYDISDEEESDEEEGDTEGGGGDRGTLVDPAVRRAKAVRATARRIARLPKPKTLSSCVDALRQARRADDSASSKSTIDRADEAEGAVHAAEALIRAAPEEIIGCAPALVSALLHAHPATPDYEPMGAARMRALAAVAVIVPGLAGPSLVIEGFTSGRCDAGQKLEVLDAVADAARELAALPPIVDRDQTENRDNERLIGNDKSNESNPRKVGKERVFAPASLARLRGGTKALRDARPRRTRAHLIGASLAGPLLARAAELVRSAENASRVTAVEDAKAKLNPNTAVHVPGGGIDALVMGRLLGCLGECCAAARNAPDAAKIAGAVLELSLNPAVFAHTQPHVRRAALFACVGAVTSVPPAAAWHALSGGVGGVAAGSPLAGLLAALEDGAGWARGRDPDGDVRALALRAQLSAADLRQRAVAVGTAGGVDPNRADPMYLLKNVSSLMIGDM